jgi:hypothetical protein
LHIKFIDVVVVVVDVEAMWCRYMCMLMTNWAIASHSDIDQSQMIATLAPSAGNQPALVDIDRSMASVWIKVWVFVLFCLFVCLCIRYLLLLLFMLLCFL